MANFYFTSPEPKARSHVSSRGIHFEKLLTEVDWSSGYRALIQLATNLFNEQNPASPVDLMLLDDRNFEVAMTAFQIRRKVSLPTHERIDEAPVLLAQRPTRALPALWEARTLGAQLGGLSA